MSVAVTVDASVFVNAFSPMESGSDHSLEFITRLTQNGTPMIVPTLLLPEIAASVARKQGQTGMGVKLADDIRLLPNIMLVALDESLAQLAAQTAAKYKLRGSDAVYAAVALRFGALLVTLDREQLERLAPALPVSMP